MKTEVTTLRQLLASRDMTQLELAERAGVSEPALSHWISGKRIPRLDSALSVALQLDITLDQLAELLGL